MIPSRNDMLCGRRGLICAITSHVCYLQFQFIRTLGQYNVDSKCCNEYMSKLHIRYHRVINVIRQRGEKR